MALPQALKRPARLMTSARARRQHRLFSRLQDLLLIAMLLISVVPILYLILSSFKSGAEFIRSSSFLPQEWRFRNYPEMWRLADFGLYFKNSLIVCGATTALGTCFSAMTGYALSRFRFPGSELYGLTVMGTQLIPGTLFFIPLYLSFVWLKNTLGLPLLGSNLGGIVLYTGFYIPISLWVMRSFFAAIPVDLEEQAQVDGATRLRAFWQIVLPLASPGIISTAIFIFLTAWDEMFFASILRVQTVPRGLLIFASNMSTQNRYELVCAGAVVVTLPILLVFLLVQRWLVQGLTAGAVK
jgi:multiple sugar transport system permease protein